MNEKFFSLPHEKQQAILNAGYRVFSQNSYKNSPMSEIADEAGISKSLLFHYFHNKKELYLYLWNHCAQVTIEQLTAAGCYEKEDVFEMMYSGMQAKLRILQQHPDLGSFVIRAFYERDPAVRKDIQTSYLQAMDQKANTAKLKLDPAQFVEGLDIQMMYREMFLASEGYLWEKVQWGELNLEAMERDFSGMIEFWKKIYLRKEE